MTESISDGIKVLENGKRRRLIVDDRKDALSQLGSAIKAELYKQKLEFWQYKTSLNNEQVKSSILSGLSQYEDDTDANSAIDNAPKEEDINMVYDNLTEMKDKLEECKLQTENLCENLDECSEKYKASMETLERTIDEYTRVKNDNTQAWDRCEAVLNNTPLPREKFTTAEKYHEIQELLRETMESRHGLESRISEASQLLDDHLQEKLENQELISNAIKLSTRLDNGLGHRIKWCDEISCMLSTMPSVSDMGIVNNVWTIGIDSPRLTDSENSHTKLTVNITLNWGENDVQLTAAEVDSVDLDVEEITNQAVETNNTKGLLEQIYSLWIKHYPIVTEIEHLRKRYAIDWDQTRNKLTVIFGSSICVLQVNPGYPSQKSVTLETVKGHDNLDKFQMSDANSSLTQWLEHLHGMLTTAKESMEQ